MNMFVKGRDEEMRKKLVKLVYEEMKLAQRYTRKHSWLIAGSEENAWENVGTEAMRKPSSVHSTNIK